MPKYTIEQMRLTARSKDNRLEDTKKYPDGIIDSNIEEAFQLAESGRQVFVTEDALDIAPYVNDGVEKFLYETTEECHKITQIFATVNDGLKIPVYTEGEFPQSVVGIKVYLNNDNTVSVTLDVDGLLGKDIVLSFRYYYVPSLGFTEIFMSPEVFSYFQQCLYVSLYGMLRDRESEIYHQALIDKFIKTGSFGIENNFDEFIDMKTNWDNIGISVWV